MSGGGNFKALVLTTAYVYRDALKVAGSGVLRNWYVPLIHLVSFALAGVAFTVSQLFGYPAGGFLFSIVLTGFVASYYSTVAAAVEREKVQVRELWNDMVPLYVPFLSALFVLWIIGFVVNAVLQPPEIISAAVKLAITVILNPLPEIVTTHRYRFLEAFSESFEFVVENFFEWFIPLVVILGLANLLGLATFETFFSSENPLIVVKFMYTWMGTVLAAPERILPVLFLIVFVYFIFVFRLALYKRLATSTRRKRLYQFRMGI